MEGVGHMPVVRRIPRGDIPQRRSIRDKTPPARKLGAAADWDKSIETQGEEFEKIIKAEATAAQKKMSSTKKTTVPKEKNRTINKILEQGKQNTPQKVEERRSDQNNKKMER
jgi:hypothetical protein